MKKQTGSHQSQKDSSSTMGGDALNTFGALEPYRAICMCSPEVCAVIIKAFELLYICLSLFYSSKKLRPKEDTYPVFVHYRIWSIYMDTYIHIYEHTHTSVINRPSVSDIRILAVIWEKPLCKCQYLMPELSLLNAIGYLFSKDFCYADYELRYKAWSGPFQSVP